MKIQVSLDSFKWYIWNVQDLFMVLLGSFRQDDKIQRLKSLPQEQWFASLSCHHYEVICQSQCLKAALITRLLNWFCKTHLSFSMGAISFSVVFAIHNSKPEIQLAMQLPRFKIKSHTKLGKSNLRWPCASRCQHWVHPDETKRCTYKKGSDFNDPQNKTLLKINGWNIIPWRFGSDHVPF